MRLQLAAKLMGNRNKAQATQRLIELGITPGNLAEKEGAAAFCGMSTSALRKWLRDSATLLRNC